MSDMRELLIRLPRELVDHLDRIAAERSKRELNRPVPRIEIIREALSRYVEAHPA